MLHPFTPVRYPITRGKNEPAGEVEMFGEFTSSVPVPAAAPAPAPAPVKPAAPAVVAPVVVPEPAKPVVLVGDT